MSSLNLKLLIAIVGSSDANSNISRVLDNSKNVIYNIIIVLMSLW